MSKFKTLLTLLFVFSFYGCTESIDDSSMFISSDPTMVDYLEADANYSDFVSLLQKVKLSNNANASSLASVLDARGNYTCFAPDNKSIREFLEMPLGTPLDTALVNDSVAGQITKSCIIDNGSNAAYSTPDFPSSGAFSKSNLNDRVLMVVLDSATSKYKINSSSLVIKSDVEVSNGYIHFVDNVISPSTNSIPVLMKRTPNMSIMAKLLEVTTLNDSLSQYRDEVYENSDIPETGLGLYGGQFQIPQHRYIGFTAFVETDDVFVEKWGVEKPILDEKTGEITNWDAIFSTLEARCNEVYTSTSDDLSDEGNAVNQFVSYHFISGGYAYNTLVWHYCEYNYEWGDKTNPQRKILPVDKWAFFNTLGKGRRMLKITQSSADEEHNQYINRKTIYENEPSDAYKEELVIDGSEYSNVKLLEKNEDYDNNSVNGFIFPIDRILVYDNFVKETVLNDRLRLDVTYIMDEMASNNLRNTGSWRIMNNYFDNVINVNDETRITYICHALYGSGAWRDYEGDEFLFLGLFDFTMRLPSVPVEGTYELRMGCSNNSLRGMAQIYFGDNPNALAATGLPIDLRQSGSTNNPNIPWVADTEDQETNRENDKNLRNQNYMKGPQYYTASDGKGGSPVRASNLCLRHIITRQHMVPGKTYYVRYKSALDNTDSQFFVDYFELVPKTIYANEANPEDIW